MSDIFTSENLLFMLNGMKLTLEIAVLASIISIVLGTVLALAKAYCKKGPIKILDVLATIYVEIFRCTPQLLWILMFRFFIKGGGFNLGVISLSIVNAPYICEIVRGGLNNINKGQFEAGYSQGYSFLSIVRLIVLPQCFRAVLPSMLSQIVSIIKGTSLLASINIFEFLFTCNAVMVSASSLSGIFAVYAMEAFGYFSVCFLLVTIIKRVSHKLRFA